mmetsp:Transcript_4723/g.20190  ORF Transcript_4723/g.20190 Transcript_4723/m.20190 type:complete len:229 (+) Transcript_4723:5702-6388(+)
MEGEPPSLAAISPHRPRFSAASRSSSLSSTDPKPGSSWRRVGVEPAALEAGAPLPTAGRACGLAAPAPRPAAESCGGVAADTAVPAAALAASLDSAAATSAAAGDARRRLRRTSGVLCMSAPSLRQARTAALLRSPRRKSDWAASWLASSTPRGRLGIARIAAWMPGPAPMAAFTYAATACPTLNPNSARRALAKLPPSVLSCSWRADESVPSDSTAGCTSGGVRWSG